jgi:hypothetical protein
MGLLVMKRNRLQQLAATPAIVAIAASPAGGSRNDAGNSARLERRYRKGTRVRIDMPGFRFHGHKGTVEFGMATAESPCIIQLDSLKGTVSGRTVTASNEVARLRDQSPHSR